MIKSLPYRFLLLIVFIAFALIYSLTRNPTPKTSSMFINRGLGGNPFVPSVLVIDMSGSILSASRAQGNTGVNGWISELERAASTDNIRGVLVYMNSPGGSVVPSQELYSAMVRFRETDKPLYVSIADLCASGGYYAAAPATTIIANRGSLIGSIGVRISNNNISELLKKVGISSAVIKSVPHKDFLSATRDMTLVELAHVQKIVDDMHEQFISDIITWRGDKSSPEQLRAVANGFLYLSDEALEYGLIDQIGTFHDAKMSIANELDIPYEDLNFIEKKPLAWWPQQFLSMVKSTSSLHSLIKNLDFLNALPSSPQY